LELKRCEIAAIFSQGASPILSEFSAPSFGLALEKKARKVLYLFLEFRGELPDQFLHCSHFVLP
jgi:hypothetical protein